MAASAPRKKFANSNLNAVLGAPKASPTNNGPAVHSAAVIKPVAKPKGLISLGKAPAGSSSHVRKGAAWSQLEEKAQEKRTEVDAKKDELANPEWAIMDIKDLDKPRERPDSGLDQGEEYPPTTSAENEASTSQGTYYHPTDEVAVAAAVEPQAERQFSNSHRSYLSMEYVPSATSDGALAGGNQPGSNEFHSPPVQDLPSNVPRPAQEDVHCQEVRQPEKSRTRSWAEQTENSEEEEDCRIPEYDTMTDIDQSDHTGSPAARSPSHGLVSSLPPGTPPPARDDGSLGVDWNSHAAKCAYKTLEAAALEPSAGKAPMGGMPVGVREAPAGPPPARRSPPPVPPPARNSTLPTKRHPAPAGPPPPMPPPSGPPASLAADRAAVPPPAAAPPAAPTSLEPVTRMADSPVERSSRSSSIPHQAPVDRDRSTQPSNYNNRSHPSMARVPARDPRPQSPGNNLPADQRTVEPSHEPRPSRWNQGRPESLFPPDDQEHRGAAARHPPSAASRSDATQHRVHDESAAGHDKGIADAAPNCWGPAVTYTPAFAPRPPPAERPMSEDFVNSGWKEKKLWTPPPMEEERPRGNRSVAAGLHTRQRPEGQKTAESAVREEPTKDKVKDKIITEESSVAEPVKPTKPPKAAKAPKGPLEALDPDSSSSDESDSSALPPEYAVLDMTVPRTALVINVSHVLKRLNGCCSLNQLTKNLKAFKDKTGVTLEAFLRANPMTFKLEGRIVHYLDKNGDKWKPPKEATQAAEPAVGSKGKGKSESRQNVENKTESWTAQEQHSWSNQARPSGHGRAERTPAATPPVSSKQRHGGADSHWSTSWEAADNWTWSSSSNGWKNDGWGWRQGGW